LDSIQDGIGVVVIEMVGDEIELVVVDGDGEAVTSFEFLVSVSETFNVGVWIEG